MDRSQKLLISNDLAGQTLAAALRALQPGLSWSDAKRLVTSRRVEINGVICLNDARRLSAGDSLTVHEEPLRPVPADRDVRILHIDPDLIVIDKPAGVQTLRRDEESEFSEQRKSLAPTLDEIVPRMLPGGARAAVRQRGRDRRNPKLPRIYAVHRLDRDTSGLMMFALSPRGRDALIDMLSRHAVNRTYLAVVHGRIEQARTIESWIVRDRGDGLRGSGPDNAQGAKRAVTHVRPIDHIGARYTVVECRLESGRTHQIRIHLSELGHMLCGEKLYLRAAADAPLRDDDSGAPRHALHSARLELRHPISKQELRFASPWPPRDLAAWLERIKA